MFDEFTAEELQIVSAMDTRVAAWMEHVQEDSFFNFVPRPDDVANYDQQHSFCYNRDPLSILVGGNAAGTTEAGAYKTAMFLLRQQPPPRKDTPFWILSNTYDQVGGVIWKEKLMGHSHIPRSEIEWDRVSWRDQKQGHPAIVPLKPWPESRGGSPDKNWAIHFKSYEQGRESLQAASIGGFFFSEQFPLDILVETFRGCREYMFPGGQFAEFTPIDPELCLWVEQAMDEPPPGWRFYRCNTAKNRKNLAAGWFESFFASVPDELMETRLTGALAIFAGSIYQSFHPHIHVVDIEHGDIPPGCRHNIGTDWGASEGHPQVSVLGAEDGAGTWWIYDHYFSRDQTKITEDHCKATIALAASWGWPTKKMIGPKGEYTALVNNEWYGQNYGDPSGLSRITEYNARGLTTWPANNNVYEGINYVRSLMKLRADGRPRIYISKRCEHGLAQLRKYRWKQGKRAVGKSGVTTAAAAPIPLKREDDFPDALRYLLFSTAQRPLATPSDMQRAKTERASIQQVTGSRGVQLRKRG